VGLLDRILGGVSRPGPPAPPASADAADREARALYDALSAEVQPGAVPQYAIPQFVAHPSGLAIHPSGQAILVAAPDVRASMLVIACREAAAGFRGGELDYRRALFTCHLLELVLRGKPKPQPTPEQVTVVLDLCGRLVSNYLHTLPLTSLLGLVSTPPAPIEVGGLQRLRTAVAGPRGAKACKVVERIDRILAGGVRPLEAGGPWSARVLDDVAREAPGDRERWRALVAHLAESGGAEPSARWTRDLNGHVEAIGRSPVLTRALEWLALAPMTSEAAPQVPERDADFVKGFVWLLAAFDDPAIGGAVADLAERCLKKVPGRGPVCARAGNACIRVLAHLPGHEPIAQLGRLRERVKYAVGRSLVEKALTEASARLGLAPEALEEIAVPTFGLDRAGTVQREIGEFAAELRIAGSREVSLSWISSQGRRQKGIPASLREAHGAELAAVRKTIKTITALLPGQKARLERLLVSDREVPLADWRARYPEHPLVGEMARRLIWLFADGGHHVIGALEGDRILDADDRPLELSPAATVRAWHPLGSTPDVVLAWRSWLERHRVVQPFKQAHREIYLLTGAEVETGTYSNRFAAHVLRQHQFASLCRERGWRYTLQGGWDSHNVPRRRLDRWNLDIEFFVDGPTDGASMNAAGIYDHVFTDQVRFVREREAVRLADVPELAFSEAMRDVDLFVGVCSIGNDPAWADHGEQRYADYWQRYSFGELSSTGAARREILAGLIPRLRCADRLSLEDRYLVVRGDLWSYKIHLGSGNILMEPGSRYLCIVPGPRDADEPRDVWLPFEGDRGLSIVLSKALLLVRDREITDPQIARQIRRAPAATITPVTLPTRA